MIQPERVSLLKDIPPSTGRYVLYWMQASQRAVHNPALEYAIGEANRLELPVLVCFGLMDDYPEANERHYAFLLQGLRDVREDLAERGIQFIVKKGQPAEVAIHFAQHAAITVCDRGYTRFQKQWRERVTQGVRGRVVRVEGDVVVPVETASDHQEFGARTIRPKIHKHWEKFLQPLKAQRVKHPKRAIAEGGDIDVSDPKGALAKLKVDRSVKASPCFVGGHRAAMKRLADFIGSALPGYAQGRNEPAAGATSRLSAYLHFGNISPVEIVLAAREAAGARDDKSGEDISAEDREALLEELIVRRELAMNYVHYCGEYDRFDGLPAWAKKTLEDHAGDKREHLYTREQLEAGKTFDPYWNAAQMEMVKTGFMQNYMRMYWGKKILEWTADPREAYETTLYLNNKYFLCGRDPNSFAGVGWVFGLHDRPWTRRKIFGTIRYMNAAGLERKFDIEKYVAKVAAIEA
jgi:deoxyribodipyrimidine photo-lyase